MSTTNKLKKFRVVVKVETTRIYEVLAATHEDARRSVSDNNKVDEFEDNSDIITIQNIN